MSFKLKKDNKYIFATDLDGTFLSDLNSSLHIDSYEAVKMIQEAGHRFIITTGRSWWWTETLYEQLGSVDASIHFAGAIIHHDKNEDFDEYRSSISKDIFKKMANEIDIWSFAHAVQAVGRKKHATWSKNDDLNKLFFNCYEFIIIFDINKINPEEVIKKIEKSIGNNATLRVWTLFLEEKGDFKAIIISPKGTNKSIALQKVADYYNIPQENVIYFGDNANDIEALHWAGYSYAPKNAIPEAKEAADEILEKTATEGAVPKKIIKLLNKQNERN